MWKGFQKPKRLAAELDSLTDKYGKFSAQPFERGWGTTVGNALRRALLSSIEGAAITAVKIEGVLHEFSSIPGVVEDATDIILNLKQVPLKLNTDQSKTITLNAVNPGVVTSAMIEEDADFAVLDRNVYIATVSEGGKMELEMRVKNGRGYVGADRNFDEDLPIGYIPVDSVHSPVRKVNYSVEAARLGQMTDYEKLMLEVWTNGAITPQDAIGLAAKLIKDHMSIFINFEEQTELPEEAIESYNDPRLEHLDRSVEELELSVRSYNCLKNANIQTIRELLPGAEDRKRNAENEKLWPQVAQRDQGNSHQDGFGPGDEIRRARPHHLAAASQPDRSSHSGGNRGVVTARSTYATSEFGIEAGPPQPGAPPGYVAQLGDVCHRAGAHHDDAHPRQSRSAARGEGHHARQAGLVAHPASGGRLPDDSGGNQKTFSGYRSAVCGPRRWVHAHHSCRFFASATARSCAILELHWFQTARRGSEKTSDRETRGKSEVRRT